MRLRSMTLIFMAMMVLASPQIKADEATCRETLRKCDLAVHALQEDNNQKQSIIDDQAKLISVQKSAIEDSRAWYRQPEIIIPLALLVGVAGGVYLTK